MEQIELFPILNKIYSDSYEWIKEIPDDRIMSIDVYMITRYLSMNGFPDSKKLLKLSLEYHPTAYRMFLFYAWKNTPNDNQSFLRYYKNFDFDKFVEREKDKQKKVWSENQFNMIKNFTYKEKENELEEMMLKKYVQRFKIPSSDFKKTRSFYLNHLRKNKTEWLSYFGIEKKFWKKFGVDYKEFKNGLKFVKSKEGLQKFGF